MSARPHRSTCLLSTVCLQQFIATKWHKSPIIQSRRPSRAFDIRRLIAGAIMRGDLTLNFWNEQLANCIISLVGALGTLHGGSKQKLAGCGSLGGFYGMEKGELPLRSTAVSNIFNF